MKVSVVVPVFNVEQYLGHCLETLVNQTLQEIEIIIVNDGSTDRSQDIIDQYVLKYPMKVKAYKKTNGGLSDARNFGMQYITGDYVGFIDSDDYVELDMYESLYKEAVRTDADIVECNLYCTYEDHEEVRVAKPYIDKLELIAFGCSVAWNKIYKTRWLKKTKVSFPKGINHEDIDFFCLIVPYLHKISYIKPAYVHYVQREGSINNARTERLRDIHKVFVHLDEEYKKRELMETYGIALEALAVRIFLGSAVERFSKIRDKKIRKQILKDNWKFLNERYPQWKQNPLVKKQKGMRFLYYRHCFYGIYQVIGSVLSVKNRR